MMMITFHHYSLKKLALNLVFLFCGLVQCKEQLHYTRAILQILILIMYLCPHNYMSMIEPYLKCMLSQLKQKAKANWAFSKSVPHQMPAYNSHSCSLHTAAGSFLHILVSIQYHVNTRPVVLMTISLPILFTCKGSLFLLSLICVFAGVNL